MGLAKRLKKFLLKNVPMKMEVDSMYGGFPEWTSEYATISTPKVIRRYLEMHNIELIGARSAFFVQSIEQGSRLSPVIGMPTIERFDYTCNQVVTLFHEVIHSTATFIDRKEGNNLWVYTIGDPEKKRDLPKYATEELIAIFGSFMLWDRLFINRKTWIERSTVLKHFLHAQYNYFIVTRKHKMKINLRKIIAEAHKATEFILQYK